MAGLTRGKGAKTARSHGISRRIKRNVLLCRQRGTERRRKFCIGDNIAGAVGMKYSKSEIEQTIPQSAMRQTAPFAQGSHGGGVRLALLPFVQGSHGGGMAAAFPLFIRGISGECARGLWPLFRFVVFEAVFGALGRPFVIAEKIVGRDVQPIA